MMLRRFMSLKRVTLFLLGMSVISAVNHLIRYLQGTFRIKSAVLGEFLINPPQSIQDKALLVCSQGGVKRSFLNLFNPLDQENVLAVLNGFDKGMDYTSFMEHSSWERVEQSFNSQPFRAAFERLVSVLDRNSSQVAKEAHSKITFQNGLEHELKSPKSLAILLNLLAQGGATNEEDLIINMYHSALDPTWFHIHRLGYAQESGLCHIVNIGLNQLNHRTIANILKGQSFGRMVFDFENYDVGYHTPKPKIQAGLVHSDFGDYYSIQINPGQSLVVELSAYEHQNTSNVNVRLFLVSEQQIEPSELNRIEICRLYRQLSRKCQNEDLRRKFLSESYPRICSEVGDFYISFKYKECLSEDYVLNLSSDAKQYIRDNLALLRIKLNSFH